MANKYSVAIGIETTDAAKGAREFTRSAQDIAKAAKDMEAKVHSSAKSFASVNSNVMSLKRAAEWLIGGSIGYAFAAMTKEVIAFDSAMTQIKSVIDESFGPVDGLIEKSKELSVAFNQKQSDQAKAYYQVIQEGASNAADATAQVTAANKLALIGQLSLEKSTDSLIGVMEAYNMKLSESAKVADIMAVAYEKGGVPIETMTQGLAAMASLAGPLGTGIDQITAAVMALDVHGFKSSETLAGMRGAMLGITKATPDMVAAAARIGVDFSEAGVKAAGGFIPFLQDIVAKGGGSVDMLGKLFTSGKSLPIVLALAGKASGDLATALDQIENSAGAADESVKIIMGSFSNQFGSLMKNIEIGFTDLMSKALPPITAMLSALNNNFGLVKETVIALAKAISIILVAQLAVATRAMIAQTLATAAAATATGALTTQMAALALVSKAGFAIGTGIGKLFNLMGGWIGITALAVWGLIEAYQALNSHMESLRELPEQLEDSLRELREEAELAPNHIASAEMIVSKMLEAQLQIVATQQELFNLREMEKQAPLSPAGLQGGGKFAFGTVGEDIRAEKEDAAIERTQKLLDTQSALAFQLARTDEAFAKSASMLEVYNSLTAGAKEELKDHGITLEFLTASLGTNTVALEGNSTEMIGGIEVTKDQVSAIESLIGAYAPEIAAQKKVTEGMSILNLLRANGGALAKEFGLSEAALAKIEAGLATELTKVEKSYQKVLDKLFPLDALNRQYKEDVLELMKAHQDGAKTAEEVAIGVEVLNKGYKDGVDAINENANATTDLASDMRSLEETLNPISAVYNDIADKLVLTAKLYAAGAYSVEEFNEKVRQLHVLLGENVEEFKKNQQEGVDPWAESMKRAIEDIDRGFVDLWRSAFKGFNDFAKAMLNTFLNLLAEMAHAAITRPIMVSIVSSMQGGGAYGSTAGQGAGGQGGVGSMFSNIGSLFTGNSIGTGFGVLGQGSIFGGSGIPVGGGPPTSGVFGGAAGYSNLAYGAAGILGGIGGQMIFGGQGGMGGSIGSMIGLAAGGPIGAIVGGLIGGFIGGLFGKKKDPRITAGGTDFEPGDTQFFDSEFGGVFVGDTRGGMDDHVKEFGDAIVVFDNTLASFLDKDQISKIADSLVGWEKTIKGKDITIKDMLESRWTAILSTFTSEIQDFVKKGKGLEEQVNRLQLATIAEKLIKDFTGPLKDIDLTTFLNAAEAMANGSGDIEATMLKIVNAFATVNAALEIDPVEAAAVYWEQQSMSMVDRYLAMSTAMDELVANSDGSIESLQRTADGFIELKIAATQLLIVFEQVRREVAAMFDTTRQSLLESTMSNQEIYNMKREQAAALFELLKVEVDPQKILQLSQQINTLVGEAFALAGQDETITPEQLDTLAFDFIAYLDQVEVAVNERLDAGINLVTDDINRLNAEVALQMETAATTMIQAAEDMRTAAEAQERAAAEFSSGVGRFGAGVGRFGQEIANFNAIAAQPPAPPVVVVAGGGSELAA